MKNIAMQQAFQFILYLACGMSIGIFFDIFRVLRRSFKTNDLFTYLEDILFWIITGIFLIFILFKFSNGIIRIYNVIALTSGSIIYLLSISRFFIKINVLIISYIKKLVMYPIKLILKIVKLIFTPFRFLVINFRKIFIISKNKKKKKKNKRKFIFKRRILQRNVEK